MVTEVRQVPATAPPPEGVGDDRLLDLFRNRAELKREFGSLRRERDRLTERLKQQEGEILRLEQRLEQLEGLLSNPRQAANTALYFQLRGLWAHCRRRLVRLAGDLREQQLALEAELAIRAADARRRAALAGIDEQREIARTRLRRLRADLAALQPARRWSGPLGNRDRRVQIIAARAACEHARAQLRSLDAERAARANEILPEPGPLSVAGRRKVNLAVIALAQELLLHFAPDGLAELARDAAVRQLTEANYGGSTECRRLSKLTAERLQELEAQDDLPARVRRRARFLEGQASYRLDSDVVPESPACALVPAAVSSAGEAIGNDVLPTNVLVEEYWDLYTVLIS